MENFNETIAFKLRCAEYHFSQALRMFENLEEEDIYKGISEFCALMEVLNSSINISKQCADELSPIDAKAFVESLSEKVIDELMYLEQFVKANREGNVFDIVDLDHIYINSFPKRSDINDYSKRKLVDYMIDINTISEYVINQFMGIYQEITSHYDQSWRYIERGRISFRCQTCGTSVTNILSHVGNLSELSLKDKDPFVPRLKYIYGHEVIRAGILPWRGSDEVKEAEILISIDGLSETIKKESATGCCGPDGSTFNVFCRNGHEIGKEAADCWMPHFIRVPMDKVNGRKLL